MTFFYLGTWGRKLRNFVETINEFHPTINFTVEWSQKSIRFMDVTVSLIDGQTETDLYVKATRSHQCLHSSLCHPYDSYEQALRLNRVFFKDNVFDIHFVTI